MSKRKMKPKKYWANQNNIFKEAKKVIARHRLNHLPPHGRLVKLGYASLTSAINRYTPGYRFVREKLGEDQLTVEKGYWQNEENVIKEARSIMDEQRCALLPGAQVLARLGYTYLNHAIKRYHGGFYELRKLLGEKQKRNKRDSWKSLDYTLKQAKKIIRKNRLDCLPGRRDLILLEGGNALSNAIAKYHGGCHTFRNKLGENEKRKENGLWKDVEYTLKTAQEMLTEHNLKEIPSEDVLKSLKQGGLMNAIKKYHGGLPAFREKFREYFGMPTGNNSLESFLENYVNQGENE